MTEQQIADLQNLFSSGFRLAWRDPSRPLREIVSMGIRDGEPVGIFSDGHWCSFLTACPEEMLLIASQGW